MSIKSELKNTELSLSKVAEKFVEFLDDVKTMTSHNSQEGVQDHLLSELDALCESLLLVYQSIEFKSEDLMTLKNIEKTVSLVIEVLTSWDELIENKEEESLFNRDSVVAVSTFYDKKVFPLSDQLSDWKGLIHQTEKSGDEKRSHVISNDRHYVEQHLLHMEHVRRDAYYELFYLRREDGGTFFDKKLIQNLKLICQLGEMERELSVDDPLIHGHVWKERVFQLASANILKMIHRDADLFFKEAGQYKDMELTKSVKKVLMALMLSSYSRNLIKNAPVKSSIQYHEDFMYFLTAVIKSGDYQAMRHNPPPKAQQFLWSIIQIIQTLCEGVYTLAPVFSSFRECLSDWVIDDIKDEMAGANRVVERLESTQNHISKKLEKLPCGPLFQALDLVIEEKASKGFSNLKLQHFSFEPFKIETVSGPTHALVLPSPTEQVYVHKAVLTYPFVEFLRNIIGSEKDKILIVNFQDKTSWREFSRVNALEDLNKSAEFAHKVHVMTLPRCTDFYYQVGPYQDLKTAAMFKDVFLEQLTSEGTGFSFSRKMQNYLTTDRCHRWLDFVHQMLFNNQVQLTQTEREVFIEVVYFFLTAKAVLIEGVKFFSFVCKDGIDTSCSSYVSFYSSLKILCGHLFSHDDIQMLENTMFVPSLMHRQRNVEHHSFERSLSLIKKMLELSSMNLEELRFEFEIVGIKSLFPNVS